MNKEKTNQKDLSGEKASMDNTRPKITEWADVESANFFRFEKFGDTIQGVLIKKEESARYGFGLYTLKKDDDTMMRFHGSSQLDDLLSGIDLPCIIKIEFIDSQDTPNGAMKLFKVQKGICG